MVQRALALAEKATRGRSPSMESLRRRWPCRKAKEENDRLTDKRLALIMELGTIKDDFTTFREKAVADRETMEAGFDA